MPTLPALQLPPPANWQDFEALCCDLWREIWGDPHTQENGRSGQAQDGVDIFGRPNRGRDWAGVQCKLKRLDGVLSAEEIEAEAKKARNFNPRLARFILATTAARDVKAQAAARKLTEDGDLEVTVFAWDDIVAELARRPKIVTQHFPGYAPIVDRTARSDYLAALWSRLMPVPMLGIGRRGSRSEEIPLSAVYTALDVTAEVHVKLPRKKKPRLDWASVLMISDLGGELYVPRFEHLRARVLAKAQSAKKRQKVRRSRGNLYSYQLTALEASAVSPRLVLLGEAGSGKSTFARYLALCLAGELLGRPEVNLRRLNCIDPEADLPPRKERAWPYDAALPVFVELRHFVRSEQFPTGRKPGDAGHLLAWLEAPRPEDPRCGDLLRRAFGEPEGAFLVLDGLDETPADEKLRRKLKEVIASFAERYPHCRILVTSRPYAYEKEDAWRLDGSGFKSTRLAPFDQAKIEAYVEGWYRHLAARRQVTVGQAERQSRSLLAEIGSTDYLRPLAERPLMLTMMG